MLKILLKIVLGVVIGLAVLAGIGYVYLYVLPKGPEVTEVRPIKEKSDSFVVYAHERNKRKSIKVFTYKPIRWKNEDQILFVMHGGGRNADDYLRAWIDLAEENNILLIVPEFANKYSRYTTNDYQEGNLFTFFGTKNPKDEWAYKVIENIFDHVKSINNITNVSYDIFGHSAGAQFVHRMVMLMPEAHINTAVAANAGFYTFPNEDLAYPYGYKRTGLNVKNTLSKAFKKDLVIMLGELDNDPDLGTFRTTDLAMQQGGHRLERGSNFFQNIEDFAKNHEMEFNWKLDTIPEVGHNYKKMSEVSIKYYKK